MATEAHDPGPCHCDQYGLMLEWLADLFPNIFDIKYLMKFCDNLHGGLNKLAEVLDVERIGPQHQVGPLLPYAFPANSEGICVPDF